MIRVLALLAALILPLATCGEATEQAAPAPVEVGSESTGYYCGMLLAEHTGPKGQVHLAGRTAPLWFSSVRDAVAFTRMPGEPRDITAIYVNDMGGAGADWAQPAPGSWIDANQAYFVIDSGVRGGMGAPEAVPFAEAAAADRFVAEHGGRVRQLSEIPDRYVIGPAAESAAMPGMPAAAGERGRDSRKEDGHAAQ